MYASVRTYRSDPAKMDELLGIVDSDFVPTISDLPGFCGYQVIDCGDGSLVTISCFTSAEGVDASVEAAGKFVSERLADYDIERIDARNGAMRISVAGQAMLEPAHV